MRRMAPRRNTDRPLPHWPGRLWAQRGKVSGRGSNALRGGGLRLDIRALSASPALHEPRFGDPPSLRRRAVSLGLATTITFLILLAFVGLSLSKRERPEFKGGPTLIDLAPEAESVADAPKQAETSEPQARPKPSVTPPPPPVPVEPPPVPVPDPSPYILLSKQEYEAYEKATPRPRPAPAPGGSSQQASGSAPGDSQPIGTAPNGEPLYAVRWHRRPRQAELGPYLPRNVPNRAWGLIACRTVPTYRVEDCAVLGSSPAGSRMGYGVLQAAWQFRVRPPRRGGKELYGTWVSIRITIGPDEEEDEPVAGPN